MVMCSPTAPELLPSPPAFVLSLQRELAVPHMQGLG